MKVLIIRIGCRLGERGDGMEVGISIAGGAVPKLASIGVIQALQEEGIKISHITGTSAGSIVAALFAHGFTPEEMKKIASDVSAKWIDVNWKGIIQRFSFHKQNLDGFVKGEKFERYLEELLGDVNFQSLKLPCAIVAADIQKGTPIIFTNREEQIKKYEALETIPISKAVRASCSIPVMFEPVRFEDYILVDGGLILNCPVTMTYELGANKVIAIDPISHFPETAPYDDLSFMLNRSMTLVLEQQMENELKKADVQLMPNVGNVGLFEFSKIEYCIERGYIYTKGQMDQIRKALM